MAGMRIGCDCCVLSKTTDCSGYNNPIGKGDYRHRVVQTLFFATKRRIWAHPPVALADISTVGLNNSDLLSLAKDHYLSPGAVSRML